MSKQSQISEEDDNNLQGANSKHSRVQGRSGYDNLQGTNNSQGPKPKSSVQNLLKMASEVKFGKNPAVSGVKFRGAIGLCPMIDLTTSPTSPTTIATPSSRTNSTLRSTSAVSKISKMNLTPGQPVLPKNLPRSHPIICPLVLTEKTRRSLMTIVELNNAIALASLLACIIIALHLNAYIGGKSEVIPADDWLLRPTPWVIIGCSLLLILYHAGVQIIIYMCRFSSSRIFLIKNRLFDCFQVVSFLIVFPVVPVLLGFILFSHMMAIPMFDKVFAQVMKSYHFHVDNQMIMDRIQQDQKCCGSIDYFDWFGHNMWRVEAKNRSYSCMLQIPGVTKRGQCRMVPHSCCNVTSIYSCAVFMIDEKQTNTIYREGCATLFGKAFNRFLYQIMEALAVVFGVEMVTLIVVQLLRTSIHNAIIGGHPKITAFGWMWGDYMDDIDQEEFMKNEKLKWKMPVLLISELMARKAVEIAEKAEHAKSTKEGRQYEPNQERINSVYRDALKEYKPQLFGGQNVELLREQGETVKLDQGVMATGNGLQSFSVGTNHENVDPSALRNIIKNHQERNGSVFSSIGDSGGDQAQQKQQRQSKYSRSMAEDTQFTKRFSAVSGFGGKNRAISTGGRRGTSMVSAGTSNYHQPKLRESAVKNLLNKSS